ncbi:hypothetical protein BDZ91DRAFT_799275 [Kalaharituber pfeilii]|nr:hypothetical protein BDZ91DRAFT_799275 [Kalaharituber pfeilii]
MAGQFRYLRWLLATTITYQKEYLELHGRYHQHAILHTLVAAQQRQQQHTNRPLNFESYVQARVYLERLDFVNRKEIYGTSLKKHRSATSFGKGGWQLVCGAMWPQKERERSDDKPDYIEVLLYVTRKGYCIFEKPSNRHFHSQSHPTYLIEVPKFNHGSS